MFFLKKKPDAILLLIESGFFCFFRFWVSVYILDTYCYLVVHLKNSELSQ